MTDQPTPETDAFRPCRLTPSDWPEYARALEIQRNAARADVAHLRAELADERAKKSDALIAAVQDITRLTDVLDTMRAAMELIAAPMRPDGTYNRDRAACGSIAREALDAINK